MNKREFFKRLRKSLSELSPDDIEERISFYNEMIDDRVEEGFSEEDAILDIGSVDEIVGQITAESERDEPLCKILPKRKLTTWEIVLLAVGSPVWIALIVAVASLAFSLYCVVWSLVVSAWAIFVSLIVSGCAGVVAGVVFALTGNAVTGFALLGASISAVGTSIFAYFGCKYVTRGTISLTKFIAKKILPKKEKVNE